MHLNSELLFRKHAIPYFKNALSVLEIGPFGFPSAFQRMVNNASNQWHTIDFPDSSYISNAVNNLTYRLSNPYDFPVPDDRYDIVLSGQVIEHVEKIWVWMKELKRITKKGGRIITVNPVSWPYHEGPVDCWRIFPCGIKALADEAGLEVEQCLFESLEIIELRQRDPKAKFIPGEAYNCYTTPQKLNNIIRWNKFIRHIPRFRNFLEIPITVSYDTISVLKKHD
jgi:SAM-dependent methyltransferase